MYYIYIYIYIYIVNTYNVFVSTKMYLLRKFCICNCIYYDFLKSNLICVTSYTSRYKYLHSI